ncbi:TPA: hypothetical protein QH023_003708 [Morganella morganii subsp. morganii]|nr:hypothetical protein [Morganella morganii subsp. morganii]
MSYSEIEKENVICHELGHWFVAKKVGFEVGDISLTFNVNEWGNAWHYGTSGVRPSPSLKSIDDLADYLKNRIAVMCAGACCQEILFGVDSKKTLEGDGEDDLSKIKELLILYRGIKHPGDTSIENEQLDCEECFEKSWKIAREIINKNEKLIRHVSMEIMKKVEKDNFLYEITQKDIESAIDAWNG